MGRQQIALFFGTYWGCVWLTDSFLLSKLGRSVMQSGSTGYNQESEDKVERGEDLVLCKGPFSKFQKFEQR